MLIKKNILVVLLITPLIFSCKSNKKDASYAEKDVFEEKDILADTVKSGATIDISESVNNSSASISSSHSSDSHYNRKHDNMRGFDPPSEDDMDDNGMTRYMEVNDDEGWD